MVGENWVDGRWISAVDTSSVRLKMGSTEILSQFLTTSVQGRG
jgi:hypothetical protein